MWQQQKHETCYIVGTFNPHSQTLVRYHLSIRGCIQLPSGLSAGLWVQVLVVAILGNRDLHLALEEGLPIATEVTKVSSINTCVLAVYRTYKCASTKTYRSRFECISSGYLLASS